MMVTGRVLDSSGEPVAGLHILAYQTDEEGYYSRGGENEMDARLCAVVRTNERGEYSLDTIRPGSYPTGGVPEHIHFEFWSDEVARQRQDLQFADDQLVSEHRKTDLVRTSTVRPLTRDSEGVWRVERDFQLR
jgi:protocatechuate 3,4-dioxygenase beta subunit